MSKYINLSSMIEFYFWSKEFTRKVKVADVMKFVLSNHVFASGKSYFMKDCYASLNNE